MLRIIFLTACYVLISQFCTSCTTSNRTAALNIHNDNQASVNHEYLNAIRHKSKASKVLVAKNVVTNIGIKDSSTINFIKDVYAANH